MSNAFAALIWWVVPAIGLIGALSYVVWVTKFEGKFQQETQRSVGQFQRFQESLRDSQSRGAGSASVIIPVATGDDDKSHDYSNNTEGFDSGHPFDSSSSANSNTSSDSGSSSI